MQGRAEAAAANRPSLGVRERERVGLIEASCSRPPRQCPLRGVAAAPHRATASPTTPCPTTLPPDHAVVTAPFTRHAAREGHATHGAYFARSSPGNCRATASTSCTPMPMRCAQAKDGISSPLYHDVLRPRPGRGQRRGRSRAGAVALGKGCSRLVRSMQVPKAALAATTSSTATHASRSRSDELEELRRRGITLGVGECTPSVSEPSQSGSAERERCVGHLRHRGRLRYFSRAGRAEIPYTTPVSIFTDANAYRNSGCNDLSGDFA